MCLRQIWGEERRRRKGNEKLKKGADNSEVDLGHGRENPKPD